MTHEQFLQVKPQWIAELAASMAATLQALGPEVRYVDFVSMLPAIEMYQAERSCKAA